jgi:dTDP-4-amino-4,6-dideoxy-D-galactose acyltransferase
LYLFSKEPLQIDLGPKIILADKKVIYHKMIDQNAEFSIANVVSVNISNNALNDLALLSGNFSRFKLDKELHHKFEIMYKTWLDRSLKREIASEVLAYQIAGETVGFVTIKKTGSSSTIGLIAVNNIYQGKKIGTELMRAIEGWCLRNDVCEIDVATQLDNKQACAFYERNGYNIKQIDYIYHYYTNSYK